MGWLGKFIGGFVGGVPGSILGDIIQESKKNNKNVLEDFSQTHGYHPKPSERKITKEEWKTKQREERLQRKKNL